VFGIGQGKVSFFLAFSVLAMGLITWVFVTSRRNQIYLQIALGLILAGALGNMYDRAVFGAVRDFLMFTVKWYPWIFNIADVLLCVGVPLLVICWMFTKEKPATKQRGFPVSKSE
jgi:signal peptidase II